MDSIIVHDDIPKAIRLVHACIRDLRLGKIDLGKLIISKSLSKEPELYTTKGPHVHLVERLRKRDINLAPIVGDRVPYVAIKVFGTGKKSGRKICDIIESPSYVVKTNSPIDVDFYLENQLKKPLMRLFTPIMEYGDEIKDPTEQQQAQIDAEKERMAHKALFVGKHMLQLKKEMPNAEVKGTLVTLFTRKVTKCPGCGVVVTKGVCAQCKPNEPMLYIQQLDEVRRLEALHCAYRSQCQRCQESRYEEDLCANQDCFLFFRRDKVMLQLNASKKALDELF